MKKIDRRSISLGNNRTRMRDGSSIRRIILHHCSTQPTRDTASHEVWWTNSAAGMGGANAVGGYHELIRLDNDGNVVLEINYHPNQVAHGAGWEANTDGYHICVAGDYTNKPLPPNLKLALIERIRFNMNRFMTPIERVTGHNEVPGQRTSCPGFDVSLIRQELRVPSVVPPTNIHTVRSGETLTTIARMHNTTVAELQRLNNIQNIDLIRVGQILRLPISALPSIQIGSRVMVKNDARNWATGQSIPHWVLGSEYSVMQIRSNNSELLLSDVISWINTNDVTLV